LFDSLLARSGLPSALPAIRREHVEGFIADQLRRYKPTTAHNRYRSLQAFFKWAIEEEMIVTSPMERMKPPIVGEQLPPMLSDDQIRALLSVCAQDHTFAGRRDEAIIRVLLDSGARRAEIGALRWTPDDPETNDVSLDERQLRVQGKGRRERLVGRSGGGPGARPLPALPRRRNTSWQVNPAAPLRLPAQPVARTQGRLHGLWDGSDDPRAWRVSRPR
jgi:site-specific recombinase XerD